MVTMLTASSDDPIRIPTTKYIFQNDLVFHRICCDSYENYDRSIQCVLSPKGQTLSQP
jgi:hypothetical protein